MSAAIERNKLTAALNGNENCPILFCVYGIRNMIYVLFFVLYRICCLQSDKKGPNRLSCYHSLMDCESCSFKAADKIYTGNRFSGETYEYGNE
jgi:hypothetical protein